MQKTYRSIFVSDIHLGSRDCKAEQLNNFLKNNTCEHLYLVGDIIDGWKIEQNKWKWKKSYSDVVRRVLSLTKRGTQVIYIVGNHDSFVRPLLDHAKDFGIIKISNDATHTALNGAKYYVVHGDFFDGISRLSPWIGFLGDRSYSVALTVNNVLNWFRYRLGFGYWSLSNYLKGKVKKAINFMFHFEKTLSEYCIKRGYDGVICGHIHRPKLQIADSGFIYMNCGDWVENCTALVEHYGDGSWEIITWTRKTDEKDPNSQ